MTAEATRLDTHAVQIAVARSESWFLGMDSAPELGRRLIDVVASITVTAVLCAGAALAAPARAGGAAAATPPTNGHCCGVSTDSGSSVATGGRCLPVGEDSVVASPAGGSGSVNGCTESVQTVPLAGGVPVSR